MEEAAIKARNEHIAASRASLWEDVPPSKELEEAVDTLRHMLEGFLKAGGSPASRDRLLQKLLQSPTDVTTYRIPGESPAQGDDDINDVGGDDVSIDVPNKISGHVPVHHGHCPIPPAEVPPSHASVPVLKGLRKQLALRMIFAGTQPGRGEVARVPLVPAGLGMGSYPISQGASVSRMPMPRRRPARVTIDVTGNNSKSSSSSSSLPIPDHGKMKQAKESIDLMSNSDGSSSDGSSSDDMNGGDDQEPESGEIKQAGEAMTMDQVTGAKESEEQADSGNVFDDTWVTTYEATHFAFGSKVFELSCQLFFDGSDGKLNLSYRPDKPSSTEVVEVKLDLKSELQELKFFTADDALDTAPDAKWTHRIHFLAMRVKMSESNELHRMGECYKPNELKYTKDKLHHAIETRYILVQFASKKMLRDAVDIMKRIVSPKRESFLEVVQLRSAQANLYYVPFLPIDEAKRKQWFMEWPRPLKKTSPFSGMDKNAIICMFPFAAIGNITTSEHSPSAIETAAEGLNEASRGGPANANAWRSACVSIKVGCHARLHKRWFNDECVNFWMQW
jgi:hypothetical protein